SIAPGTTSGTADIPIVNDNAFEPDEQFRVVLGPPSQGVLLSTAAVVTIHDDDPAPISLSIPATTVSESSVIVDINVNVTPSDPPGSGFLLAPVPIPGLPATPGEDVAPFATKARIPLAGGSTTVAVSILDDDIFENDETFRLTVGRPDVPGEQASG